MSLVERALKKLQEARAGVPGADVAVAPRPAQPVAGRVRPAAIDSVPALDQAVSVEPPRRTVAIDKNALRAMELLPPEQVERQIASQYQHIKRPLVAAALSKSDPKIPNGHLIMLASALSGEGKTFTSINLALSMALEKDVDVLLVDADVAKPHVSRVFGLQGEPGLLDLLVDTQLRLESLILPTSIRGLSVLPAGRHIDTATELLASERMLKITAQLGAPHGRRVVLFDSPPLLLSTESRALLGVVGQVVMVVRAELTLQHAVADALGIIGDSKPVSLILNQSSAAPATGYYGYGSYGDAKPE